MSSEPESNIMPKSFGKKLIYILITIVVSLIIIDVCLNMIEYLLTLNVQDKRCSLSYYKNKDWGKPLFQELHEINDDFAPFIEWKDNEFHGKYINVNAQGVRKTWNPSPVTGGHVAKIYVFGGSTVWGTGSRDDFTIPSQLSKLLFSHKINCEVYNYGTSAYTFNQEIIRLLLLLRDGHRPTLVIFYDGVNDVYASYQSGVPGTIQNEDIIRKKLKLNSAYQLIKEGAKIILSQSKIIDFRKLKSLFFQTPQFHEIASTYDDDRLNSLADGIVREYAQSRAMLDQLAKSYSFAYVCLWQPVIFTENSTKSTEGEGEKRQQDKTLAFLYRKVNDKLKNTPMPHFYDLSDALRERVDPVYIDFCHLSEEGNSLIARKIYPIIQKNLSSSQLKNDTRS
jgi:lysophospholipase L1-like esterase